MANPQLDRAERPEGTAALIQDGTVGGLGWMARKSMPRDEIADDVRSGYVVYMGDELGSLFYQHDAPPAGGIMRKPGG